MGVWQDLTGYADPTLQLVRLENPGDLELADYRGRDVVITLLTNVHTLEIGHGYAPDCYPDFWNHQKELGSQLKTIRFEIPGETEPIRLRGREYEACGGELLDGIEELVV